MYIYIYINIQYIICTSTIITRQSRLVFLGQKRYTVNNSVTVLEGVAIKEENVQRKRYRQQREIYASAG